MIVRPLDDALALITQPDHARLARRIMEHCPALAGHPRRDDVLLAVGEHDNGWAEPDAAPVIDPETGRLADFVRLPLPARHGVWRRGVARLAHRPWSAALVAHHAVTVYERYRADRDWDAFFVEMERARDAMIDASGRPAGELAGDYAFVRLGDLISLAFCTGSNERAAFGGWSLALDGERVLITPGIFGGATIPIEIEARAIPDRPWPDDAALRGAVAAARPLTIRGEVAGTS